MNNKTDVQLRDGLKEFLLFRRRQLSPFLPFTALEGSQALSLSNRKQSNNAS
jgi:hypothetical protein